MARIRSIKPEFPQSETIGKLSRDARLLFIQLWTIVDDSGRARAASRMLASLLYPYDDDAPKLIGKWLDELENANCIRRYEADGSTYLEITNWLKHQRIDKPTPSKIPAFDDTSQKFAKVREASCLDKEVERDREEEKEKDHGAVAPEKISTPRKPKTEIEIPDWVPREDWDAFVEMRAKSKHPLTEKAKQLALLDLEKLKREGHSPSAVLRQSVMRSYRGLFAVQSTGPPSKSKSFFEIARNGLGGQNEPDSEPPKYDLDLTPSHA